MMNPDIEIKTLVNRLEKVKDTRLLKAIKSMLDYGLKDKEKSNIDRFVGILSEEEANNWETVIADGCERIDNEW